MTGTNRRSSPVREIKVYKVNNEIFIDINNKLKEVIPLYGEDKEQESYIKIIILPRVLSIIHNLSRTNEIRLNYFNGQF